MSPELRRSLWGLYVITPDSLLDDPRALLDAVSAAIRGGARLIQLRDKQHDADTRLQLARRLAALCHQQQARLIINDDVSLAAASGADGVHLGASDGSPAAARALLGPDAIIGATCGNSLERAAAAVAAGADYVAFGRLFPSQSKPNAPPAELSTLQRARAQLVVPICAIGGITPDRAAVVRAAGAELLAVIAGVFSAPDIEAAARAYHAVFAEPPPRIP